MYYYSKNCKLRLNLSLYNVLYRHLWYFLKMAKIGKLIFKKRIVFKHFKVYFEHYKCLFLPL